ncbi:MAG TPA: hypothetical protein VII63_04985 [Caulobacteraceae bacterium]
MKYMIFACAALAFTGAACGKFSFPGKHAATTPPATATAAAPATAPATAADTGSQAAADANAAADYGKPATAAAPDANGGTEATGGTEANNGTDAGNGSEGKGGAEADNGAQANNTAAAMNARHVGPCSTDVQNFCSDVQPGGLGIRQCLAQHLDDLSGRCRDAMTGAQARHSGRRTARMGGMGRM